MYPVLGLDLSYTNAGIALINSDTEVPIWLSNVCTEPSDGSDTERADFIAEQITEVVAFYGPHRIFIEEYAFSRGTMLAKLGELGGIVKRELWRTTGVPNCWITVSSTAVKYFAVGAGGGKGKAGKAVMVAAAQPFYDQYEKDMTAKQRANDNIADALHIARFGNSRYPRSLRERR